jgi:hypothetical protein
LVGGLLALCASPASGGTAGPTVSLGKSKGLEYMKAKHLQVVTQTTQPATCDSGTSVVGGGGSMAGPAPQSTLNETYPSQPTAWHAEGNTTSGARTLTAYAVCDQLPLSYQSSQSALDTNSVLIATVLCEGAEEPIAGGGGATGPGIRTIASFPRLPPNSPLGWHPYAHNTTGNDTLWDSYVICSNLDVRYRESGEARVRPQETAKAIAKCRPEEAVVSGGWAGVDGDTTGFSMRALSTKPWDSKDDTNKVPDDGWLAKAQSLHTQNIDLVANAICKRPPR